MKHFLIFSFVISLFVSSFCAAEVAPLPKPWIVPSNLWGEGKSAVRDFEDRGILTQMNEHFMIYAELIQGVPVIKTYFFVKEQLCVVTLLVLHYPDDAQEKADLYVQTVRTALVKAYGYPSEISKTDARWNRDTVTVIHSVGLTENNEILHFLQFATTDQALLNARAAYLKAQKAAREETPPQPPEDPNSPDNLKDENGGTQDETTTQ